MTRGSDRKPEFAWLTGTHKERVRSHLESLIKSSSLPGLLSASESWAIVGGAVRDTLLTEDIETQQIWTLWPDVDIAVEGRERVKHNLSLEIERRQLATSRNTFGGLRITGSELGRLDVWCMCLSAPGNSPGQAWLRYLDRLDFVQNAVAFVWPECELVIHNRWEAQLRRKEVASLGHAVGPAQLQPIRAMALAVKLGMITGKRFRLGSALQRALGELVRGDEESQALFVVGYLQDKLSNHRWPPEVLNRFLEECLAIVPSKSFIRVTHDTLLAGKSAAYDWASACFREPRADSRSDRAGTRQRYLWSPQPPSQ